MLRQELESVDFYISQDTVISRLRPSNARAPVFCDAAIEERRRQLSELGVVRTSPSSSTSPDVVFGDDGRRKAEAFAQSSSNGAAPAAPRATIDAGLADIFEEFRVLREDEDTHAEDYETHYNMGLAYKEMDLLDEAVREFPNRRGTVYAQDGTPRYLQCCNMLGIALCRKGCESRVIWFRKGLEAPGHSEDEYQACVMSWPLPLNSWERSIRR